MALTIHEECVTVCDIRHTCVDERLPTFEFRVSDTCVDARVVFEASGPEAINS